MDAVPSLSLGDEARTPLHDVAGAARLENGTIAVADAAPRILLFAADGTLVQSLAEPATPQP